MRGAWPRAARRATPRRAGRAWGARGPGSCPLPAPVRTETAPGDGLVFVKKKSTTTIGVYSGEARRAPLQRASPPPPQPALREEPKDVSPSLKAAWRGPRPSTIPAMVPLPLWVPEGVSVGSRAPRCPRQAPAGLGAGLPTVGPQPERRPCGKTAPGARGRAEVATGRRPGVTGANETQKPPQNSQAAARRAPRPTRGQRRHGPTGGSSPEGTGPGPRPEAGPVEVQPGAYSSDCEREMRGPLRISLRFSSFFLRFSSSRSAFWKVSALGKNWGGAAWSAGGLLTNPRLLHRANLAPGRCQDDITRMQRVFCLPSKGRDADRPWHCERH